MKRNIKISLKILLIIFILVTVILRVKIYIEDNKLLNRTLYYYGDITAIDSKKGIKNITSKNIGCEVDNYIIEDYNNTSNELFIGNYPEDNEVVVPKKYCGELVALEGENTSHYTYNCNEDTLNNVITLNGLEYKIVGILENRYVAPDIYSNLIKNSSTGNTILVNEKTLKSICSENNYYYEIVFNSYLDLINFEAEGGNTFFETDIYVRNYMSYLYIGCVVLLIVNLGLLIFEKRKNSENKESL